MADASGQPLVIAESAQTHTPLDPCVGALMFAQWHAKELRQRRQSQPPHALASSVQHVAPHAHNPAGSAQGHAR